MHPRDNHRGHFWRSATLLALLVWPLAARAQPQPLTIYLAGDSTMAAKLPEKRPETGWGEALPAWFDGQQVRVDNRARNGRSTRTFIAEGRWQGIVEDLRPGDYVFIQFGHNDGSQHKVDRYTSPADYRANLERFIAEVLAKAAQPVLVTPVVRRRYDEAGNFYDTHGPYPGLVRELAAATNTPLLDMHRDSGALLLELGADASRNLFLILSPGAHRNYPAGLDDNTHFSPAGAQAMAAVAVAELRASGIGLAEFLRQQPLTQP